jgi:ubiquitin C-terminal hydrolase
MEGICGLGNIGNSCYINSALQIFSQIHELNDYLLKVHNVKRKIDSVITFEWLNLYKMIRENHCSIVPNLFIDRLKHVAIQKNRPEFASGEQNDSVDFLEFMLECIHNSLNKIDETILLKRPNHPIYNYLGQVEQTEHSIVSSLFLSCTINQYINAETNKNEFYRIEHEYRVALSIPEKSFVSIEDCFVETFKEELLTGENAWFDEKDNVKKTVFKRSCLCYTPKILILHMKRWRMNLSKKNIKIETPIVLDISRFTLSKEPCKYELFGIINHQGTIEYGHYYTYIQKNKQWFSLNDNFIQTISEENIIHESNYCLFYRKIK